MSIPVKKRAAVEKWLQPTIKDEYGCTPLHRASYFGNLAGCKEWLVRAPYWKHDVDCDGRNALYYAVWQGHKECWPVLLEAGLDARNTSLDGVNMLHLAASRGDAACVEALLCAGANPNERVRNGDDRTPLHLAASGGNVRCVEAILRAPGVVVDAMDGNGMTPLSHALFNRHRQVARALWKAGAVPLAVHRAIPIPQWLFATEEETNK